MLSNRDIRPAEFLRAVSCGSHPENLDIIRRYLEIHKGNAALINALDNDKMTALMCAAKNGYISIVNILLTSPDVQINADSDGFTALHYAARSGHTAIVKALLAIPDINVNANTIHGWTPLMLSICTGKNKITTTQALLTAPNIDLNISSREDTALTLAISYGNAPAFQALLDYKGENAINEDTITMTEKWVHQNKHLTTIDCDYAEVISLLAAHRENIKKNKLEANEAKASSYQTSSANQGDEKDKIILELTAKLKAMEALFETFTKSYSELASKKATPAPLKLFDQQAQKSESSSSVSLLRQTR